MSDVIGASVPDDLRERIDNERADGESRSAALRRLTRQALDYNPVTERMPVTVAGAVAGLSMAYLYPTVGPVGVAAVGAAHVVATLLWAVSPVVTQSD